MESHFFINTTLLNVTKTIFLLFFSAIFLEVTFQLLALHVNLIQKKIADKSKYEVMSILCIFINYFNGLNLSIAFTHSTV